MGKHRTRTGLKMNTRIELLADSESNKEDLTMAENIDNYISERAQARQILSKW